MEQAGVFHRQHRGGTAPDVLLHVPRTPFRADSVRVVPQPSRKRYLRIAILFANYLWEARRSDALQRDQQKSSVLSDNFAELMQSWIKGFFSADFVDSL